MGIYKRDKISSAHGLALFAGVRGLISIPGKQGQTMLAGLI